MSSSSTSSTADLSIDLTTPVQQPTPLGSCYYVIRRYPRKYGDWGKKKIYSLDMLIVHLSIYRRYYLQCQNKLGLIPITAVYESCDSSEIGGGRRERKLLRFDNRERYIHIYIYIKWRGLVTHTHKKKEGAITYRGLCYAFSSLSLSLLVFFF